MIRNLWADDGGALIATEWVFVATLLVLGVLTAVVAVRQALVSELTEFAQAVMGLNQSFFLSGQTNCESSTAGSSASDTTNTIHEGSAAASTASVNQNPCD